MSPTAKFFNSMSQSLGLIIWNMIQLFFVSGIFSIAIYALAAILYFPGAWLINVKNPPHQAFDYFGTEDGLRTAIWINLIFGVLAVTFGGGYKRNLFELR